MCKNILSTGATRVRVLEKRNSTKCTAAHRDTCGTLRASGDAQTPAELPSPADIHRCSNAVFKITNSNKGTAADRYKCDTVWASGNAHTPLLLLPQNSYGAMVLERRRLLFAATQPVHTVSVLLLKKD